MPVTEQGPVEGAPGAEGDENLLDDLESDKASASADEMETDSEDASEEGRLKRLVKNYKLRLTALDAKLKFQTSAAAIANRDYNEIVEQKQTLVATLNDYEDTIQQQATRIDELEHAAQELHGRIDLLSGEVAHRTQELEETREEVATYKGKRLASLLAKPPLFDGKSLLEGKGAQQVDDWISTVQRYGASCGLSEADTVSVAVTHLRDEAARVWLAQEEVLKAQQQMPTLDDVKQCLYKRFNPAATAHTHRSALDKLKQEGKFRALAAYVVEFDRICSRIPDMAEPEKIHRFVSGLSTGVRLKVCMDPVTRELYTDYDRMRAAALNAGVHFAEFTEKVQEAHIAKQEKLQQLRGRKRFRASGRSVSGGGQAGPSSGAGSSGQAGSSRQQQRYKARRAPAVTSFCIRNGLCINCYKPNKDPTTKAILHTGVNCPHPSAEGVPEGFAEAA